MCKITQHYRILAAYCRAYPDTSLPIEATPADEPCPHKEYCLNCRAVGHMSNASSGCQFHRHCYDKDWIKAHYAKVDASSLKPSCNSVTNTTHGRQHLKPLSYNSRVVASIYMH